MSSGSTEQKEFWQEHSYVVLENFLTSSEVATLDHATNEVFEWEETPGKWLKYFEDDSKKESMLCRVERFLPYHEKAAQILLSNKIMSVLEFLFEEPACLFKDKINFKLPGGGAFKPHQDAPAFTMFPPDYHITMMIPVDTLTPFNGPVEFVPKYPQSRSSRTVLAQKADGTVSDDEVASRVWQPLFLKPSDIVFFDSYIPHRSAINSSDRARRSFYITFNPKSQGDMYERYFETKRTYFPPRIEKTARGPDFDEALAKRFNLGNPIQARYDF